MEREPVFRRRRIALALAVVALCAAGQFRRPMLGTISINADAVRGLAVQAEATPGARALGNVVAQVAGALSR